MSIGRPKNKPEDIWKSINKCGEDECWPWTGHTNNGYGLFWLDGKNHYTHRFICEAVHGEIPCGMVAMHSCNNKICCNPNHISPGTVSKNTQDAYDDGLSARGEDHHKAKLTEDQVREIYKSSLTQMELSRIYGIGQTNISCIKTRKIWRHLDMS